MKISRRIVYLAGFLFSISLAITSYINSSFLEAYMQEDYVGLIYILASILTIILISRLPYILTYLGNRKTILSFSLLSFIAYILISIEINALITISAFIIYFISSSFIIACLDIFVENYSQKDSIGKFRGLYLVIMNSAWVISQIISGSIILKSSFKGIYLFAAICMAIVSFIFIFSLKKFKDPKYTKAPILKTFKSFIKNKNIFNIYFIDLLLQFFYAWMIIYTPIYLYEYMGFGWNQIGYIFTIMLLPYIFLEFPIGKLSDKIGEKKILIMGFLVTISSTIMIPFISNSDFWLWALVLFTTRIGFALIEVMSESYFFKSIKKREGNKVSFFRNTESLAYILVPMIAIPTLILVPSFKDSFFVLGAIMLIGLFIALKIQDVK